VQRREKEKVRIPGAWGSDSPTTLDCRQRVRSAFSEARRGGGRRPVAGGEKNASGEEEGDRARKIF